MFILLASKFFGWQFFNAANLNYWDVVYGVRQRRRSPSGRTRRCWSGCGSTTRSIAGLLVLVFGAWFLGWAGTLFLSSTRVIFAAAFDRVLPEKVADVSEKRHVPVWALVLMLVPAIIVSALLRVHDASSRRTSWTRRW